MFKRGGHDGGHLQEEASDWAQALSDGDGLGSGR